MLTLFAVADVAVFLSTPSARRATKDGTMTIMASKFLSTPSARRATRRARLLRRGEPISIHALREEGDVGEYVTDLKAWLFLSTPSARRATDDNTFIQTYFQFLSTPSARRATASGRQRHHQRRISIHALREEGDLRWAAARR